MKTTAPYGRLSGPEAGLWCIVKNRQKRSGCVFSEHPSLHSRVSFVIFEVLKKESASPDADEFESALQAIGKLIGFISTRPEKETYGEGPDNLWATGNNKYFVIECKSAAVSDTISKDYCNQLGGAIRWFSNEYGEAYTATPIMVHRSTIIDRQATAVPNMMIITPDKLELFKRNINEFVIAASQNDNWLDESKINNLLIQYKLRSNDILNNYMLTFREC